MLVRFVCQYCGETHTDPINIQIHEMVCKYNAKYENCYSCAFWDRLYGCGHNKVNEVYDFGTSNSYDFMYENGIKCGSWLNRKDINDISRRIVELEAEEAKLKDQKYDDIEHIIEHISRGKIEELIGLKETIKKVNSIRQKYKYDYTMEDSPVNEFIEMGELRYRDVSKTRLYFRFLKDVGKMVCFYLKHYFKKRFV